MQLGIGMNGPLTRKGAIVASLWELKKEGVPVDLDVFCETMAAVTGAKITTVRTTVAQGRQCLKSDGNKIIMEDSAADSKDIPGLYNLWTGKTYSPKKGALVDLEKLQGALEKLIGNPQTVQTAQHPVEVVLSAVQVITGELESITQAIKEQDVKNQFATLKSATIEGLEKAVDEVLSVGVKLEEAQVSASSTTRACAKALTELIDRLKVL